MTVWLLYAVVSFIDFDSAGLASFQNKFKTKDACIKVGEELNRKFDAKTLCVEVSRSKVY